MKVVITNTVALNGGDFAILDAIIRLVKETYQQEVEFTIYDNQPEIASKYYSDLNFRKLLFLKYQKKPILRYTSKITKAFNELNLKKLLFAAKLYKSGSTKIASLLLTKEQMQDLKIYSAADLVITTGGTYLVENYSLQPRIFDFEFTLALQRPLVFFTQSLGPFTKQENIKAIKNVVEKANLVLLRDKTSYNNLKQIDANISNAIVCSDVVFSLAETKKLNNAKEVQYNVKPKVGISVRNWSYFKGRTKKQGMELYNKSIAAICEYIITQLDGQVVFLSTCQGIKEYTYDDSKAAKEIYKILSEEAKANVIVDDSFHDPQELRDMLLNFDIVISTRMHFAIQSLSVGIPVFPIAYEFKTKELFKKLINESFIMDIDSIDPTTSVVAFKKFIEELPHFRKELFTKVQEEKESALLSAHHLRKISIY